MVIERGLLPEMEIRADLLCGSQKKTKLLTKSQVGSFVKPCLLRIQELYPDSDKRQQSRIVQLQPNYVVLSTHQFEYQMFSDSIYWYKLSFSLHIKEETQNKYLRQQFLLGFGNNLSYVNLPEILFSTSEIIFRIKK